MDGILPLWKPKGFTSHDCVSKARGMLRTKKIGHTGTLDPDVEGVLPLCVGKATKIVPFLTDTVKVYEAVVTMGFSTETEDASGAEVEKKAVEQNSLLVSDIKQVLEGFKGTISQIPPMYSAVKVNGRKLYEYAREGKSVERPERKIFIHNIELLSSEVHYFAGTASFSIRVTCSKGTYIRTLCTNVGKALGYPAHMSSLVRTRTAEISQEECKTLEEVQSAADDGRAEDLLLPLSRGLPHFPRWEVDTGTKQQIQNGGVLTKLAEMPDEPFLIVCDKEALAIYQPHPTKPEKVKPIRVF
ncbi:tRNA pseudouridine(55) synthase TruB [Halobacillus rhizosphaerae]|uniref:tRNA pseudouridine(55) synthase TruB n=1 Tax=Halobacillus rhizosphaerae TaxID=3064889 RepID=UPI00398B3908